MIINKTSPAGLVALASLAFLALSGPALAQSSMGSDNMAGDKMMGSSTMATYVCRPAAASEKPSAMMGTTSLVCKPIAVQMRMADGKMRTMGNPKATPLTTPDFSGLTGQQLNDAYNKWFNQAFAVNVNGN